MAKFAIVHFSLESGHTYVDTVRVMREERTPQPRIVGPPAGYKRLTVNVPESIIKDAKKKAIDDDTSISEIVRQALSDWLGKKKSD